MSTKYFSLTRSELRIDRFLAFVIGMFLSFLVTHFYLDPEEEHQSLYRIQHMIKACIPDSAEQVTTMRLVPHGLQHELQCEKQLAPLSYILQPQTARGRKI